MGAARQQQLEACSGCLALILHSWCVDKVRPGLRLPWWLWVTPWVVHVIRPGVRRGKLRACMTCWDCCRVLPGLSVCLFACSSMAGAESACRLQQWRQF